MHVVPFPVPGSAIPGMVVFRVPYRNWTLCGWSHFGYQALPVPVRLFFESRTRTGLYAEQAGLLLQSVRDQTGARARKRRKRMVNAVPEMGFLLSGNGTITGNGPPISSTGTLLVWGLT